MTVLEIYPRLPHAENPYLHKSFLLCSGEFDGANAIERAYAELKAGRITSTGIMSHYVIAEVDRGAPIIVEEIEWKGEGLEELEDKIHVREHDLIVKATDKVAQEIVQGRAK